MELRTISARRLPHFRRALLLWYDTNRRDLPWRITRDPYRVWVSEIMLQQTRVAAVLPRYEKFLNRFPSVEKLASAKIQSVLAEWSGLGYYRRARNLHAAAKVIARERKGEFPEYLEDWRKLPGVGRYTAAAVASIAFNVPAAVLDGNVDRVLRRLLKTTLNSRQSWNAAQELLDCARPGDFNQAMMELGATLCVPALPWCGQCPIRTYCRTRGRRESRNRKPRQLKEAITMALLTKGDSVLLVQRGGNENLMSGMWELPMLTNSTRSGTVIFRVRHSITKTDYVVNVVAQPEVSVESAEWIQRRKLHKLPLTGLTKKILRKADIIE